MEVFPRGYFYPPDYAAADSVMVRDDGVILVTGQFDGIDYPTSGLFTFAYRPGDAADSSAITGHFYNDLNYNGILDTRDVPLRYWAAYIDLTNTGVFVPGDPIAYADYNGYYKIDGLQPGTYILRRNRPTGLDAQHIRRADHTS